MSMSFYIARKKEFEVCRMFEGVWNERVVGQIKEIVKNALLDCIHYSGDRSCIDAEELISGDGGIKGDSGVDLAFFARTRLGDFLSNTLKYCPVNVDSADVVNRVGCYNGYTGKNWWDCINLCGCTIDDRNSLKIFLAEHDEYILLDDYYRPITYDEFEKMCSD